MYQPKVKNVQEHESEGLTHNVIPGRMLLIPIDKKIHNGLSKDEGIMDDGIYRQPIVVSYTEKITDGDMVLQVVGDYTFEAHEDEDHIHASAKKVLILPGQLSDEFLQAARSGKVKEGEEVLVKATPIPKLDRSELVMKEVKLYADGYKVYLNTRDKAVIFHGDRPSNLNEVDWLTLGTTEEFSELKKDIANVCQDVTQAACIDEICINDIIQTFDNHGYKVVKKDNN